MPITTVMDGRSWLMLALLSILWGGAFVIVELILLELPVLTTAALRVALAAAPLWAVTAVLGTAVPRTAGLLAAFGLLGLFNNAVPFSLIIWAQTAITAGLAAVLIATTPLFTALAAALFLSDERLSAARVAGVLLGLSGVAVMVGPEIGGAFGGHLLPELAVLGAALSYACAAVFARRFGRLGVPPLVVAAGQTTASALILVPAALLLEAPFNLAPPAPWVWLAVAAFACLSTALAYILYFAVLERAGANNVALVTVLVPVVAVAGGALLLREPVTFGQLAGMGLIAAGLSLTDGRLWRRARRGARQRHAIHRS